MISRYELKKINEEEILYIYLDFHYEFGKIDSKLAQEKLEEVIKKFIRDKKIVFQGTTIALIVGGILVGKLVFKNPEEVKIPLNTIYQTEEKIITNEKKETKEESVSIKEEEISKPIEQEKITSSNKKENSNETVKQVISPIYGNTNNEKKQDSFVQENEVSSDIKESPQEELPKEETNNNIYVTLKRTNNQVITIELEEYITGVVAAEMPASFHEQALMAQAVIARTYALKANSRGQVLTDSFSTQSFKNIEELRSMWGGNFNTYFNKIKNAVLNTKGEYLTYNGSYIEAVYHSTSNGKTEDSINVWGNSFPYLVSVDSSFDTGNPSFQAEKFISYEELSSTLNTPVNQDTNFSIVSKTVGDRVGRIEINNITLTGVEFRNIFGLRSADFTVMKKENGVNVTTKGYGHGVGMSQYGANGMAKSGYSYTDILYHYYQGVTINRL